MLALSHGPQKLRPPVSGGTALSAADVLARGSSYATPGPGIAASSAAEQPQLPCCGSTTEASHPKCQLADGTALADGTTLATISSAAAAAIPPTPPPPEETSDSAPRQLLEAVPQLGQLVRIPGCNVELRNSGMDAGGAGDVPPLGSPTVLPPRATLQALSRRQRTPRPRPLCGKCHGLLPQPRVGSPCLRHQPCPRLARWCPTANCRPTLGQAVLGS